MNANKVITIMPCVPSLGERCLRARRLVPRRRVLGAGGVPYSRRGPGLLVSFLLPVREGGVRSSVSLLCVRLLLASLLVAGAVLYFIGGSVGAGDIAHPWIWSVVGLVSAASLTLGLGTRPLACLLTAYLAFSTTDLAGVSAAVAGVAALVAASLAVFGPGKWSLDRLLYLSVVDRREEPGLGDYLV